MSAIMAVVTTGIAVLFASERFIVPNSNQFGAGIKLKMTTSVLLATYPLVAIVSSLFVPGFQHHGV
jgi:hypothetical protein